MPEQTIDDVDVAVLDGARQGDEFLSFEKNIAGFEHALHIRQLTLGNVITECVKFDRHLQRTRQTLVLCSDGTTDSADGDGDGDGVDIVRLRLRHADRPVFCANLQAWKRLAFSRRFLHIISI